MRKNACFHPQLFGMVHQDEQVVALILKSESRDTIAEEEGTKRWRNLKSGRQTSDGEMHCGHTVSFTYQWLHHICAEQRGLF